MEESIRSGKKPLVRRGKKQIIQLLKDYQSREGLTIVEFCKLHNINKSNFYNWRKRYGSNKLLNSKPKGFLTVELTPSADAPASTSTLFAEVNGIRLYHSVSAEYLKALVS